MTDTAHPTPYALYFRTWLVLLGITLLMVFLHASKPVLIVGIGAKASIIALWFMHLKQEKLDFILYVALSILLFAFVLFGLIAPDGLAM